MIVSRKSPKNYYIIASITSLFILNGLTAIGNWITVIQIIVMTRHQNSLATAYLFVAYGTQLGSEISLICGYPITVIADGLMVSGSLSPIIRRQPLTHA